MRALVMLALLSLAACVTNGGTPQPTTTTPAAAPFEAAAKGDDLAETVVEKLKATDDKAFRAVSVKSASGMVLLTGAVTKPMFRRKAEQTAKAVPGVDSVYNGLLLAEDGALARFAPDRDREQSLTSRLAGDPAAAGVRLRVAGGAAYLVGRVPSPADRDRLKTLLLEDDQLKWVDTGAVSVR